MQTRQKRQTRIGRLIVPAISILFLGYFAIQAQSGRYGTQAKEEFAQLLDQREAEYAKLLRQRERLEQRVQFLQDGSLERDMLDERTRRALSMVAEDEIVILDQP
ncbi:FtsB family cell division protein [Aureimonas populi]|uniref:Septum formation initiator family protein n=1 Tax=Aureimonas populi TaxID=1701758 RepID=A0ABW5CRN6_9HYPH|nr:septum formation initiator family protein [Aureimonas populi]